jgi:cation:H+ antiporter
MSLLLSIVLVAAGIAVLTAGGEALVRGSVSLARLARVSTAVIGLTIVAMGTSMPELAVSLLAALDGRGDLAMGNVVGSNIFNVAVIVGVAALVMPLMVHMTAVKIEWPFMITATFLCLLLARDGDRRELEDSLADKFVRPRAHQLAVDLSVVALGVLLLVAGARVLVLGAVRIAELAGWSERVIGLTIIAAGTSMPELATSLVAARRGQADIALANVIGSNIFNLLGILGVVALVTPQAVHPRISGVDMWWMFGTSLVLLPLMRSGFRVSRMEGAVLLLVYGVYVWFVW